MRTSKSGTVLGATLVVAIALTLVLTGLLGWANNESKVNRRNLLRLKANYAAEASAEYALAQMRCSLQQRPVYTTTLFSATGPTPPSADVLGETASTVLGSVSGSGTLGYATNIISSLATLQAGVTAPTSRYAISGTSLNVGDFTAERLQYIDPANPIYADDPLRGQRIRVREIRVLATATATDSARGESTTGYCEEILQVRDTALFGSVAFYNMDLEVQPLPVMNIIGPIHTNRSLYVTSYNGLAFDGVVTVAGDVRHGQPSGVSGLGSPSGDISFRGPSGSQVSMKTGSTWIDSTYGSWSATALSRWDKNLMNSAHGITTSMPASIPPYVPDNPATGANELVNDAHDLIEPSIETSHGSFPGNEVESSKFANKACLVLEVNHVISGAAVTFTKRLYRYSPNASGTYVRPTETGYANYERKELAVPADLVTATTFYDRRQAETVQVADVDVGVLKDLVESAGTVAEFTNGSNTFNPTNDWNGVLYVEHKNPSLDGSNMGGVRLINGRHLPNMPTAANGMQEGFTVASNAPLYIKGNYNADGSLPTSTPANIVNPESGEVPAAVAADAVTALSNDWDDANSSLGLGNRNASQTEYATAIMTGIVPSNKGNNGTWSGGLNNLVRYLEDWTDVNVGFRGAMTVFYESETATQPWSYSPTYLPPTRFYGLSQLFVDGNYPPGAPHTRSYRRIGFRQLSKAQYDAALAAINTF